MVRQYRASRITGMVFFIIGAIFAVMGGVFWMMQRNLPDEDLFLVGMVFLITGAVFLIAGAVLWAYASAKSGQVARLMEEGIAYDAEIVEIYENMNYGGQYYRRRPVVLTVDCAFHGEVVNRYFFRFNNLLSS